MTQLKWHTWETQVCWENTRCLNTRLTGHHNDSTRKGSGHLACSSSPTLTKAKLNRECNKLKKKKKMKGDVYWLPHNCIFRKSMMLPRYSIASWSYTHNDSYLQFCCFCIVAFTVQAFTTHLLKVCLSKKPTVVMQCFVHGILRMPTFLSALL